MKKWLPVILRVVVLVSCVAFLIYRVDFRYLFESVLSKLPTMVLVVSVFLSIFKLWLNGVRWKIVNIDFSRQLSNWDYFRYMMISASFNLIMPGALGGDIVKAIWVAGDVKLNKAKNVLSVFFDRAVGIISIFILGLVAFSISIFFSFKIKVIVWAIAIISMVLLALLVWYVKRGSLNHLLERWHASRNIAIKIKGVLGNIKDIVVFYLNNPRIFVYALLISFGMHVLWFGVNYLIALFLRIELSFIDISIVSCLVWFITAIPVSISGIGIREISYISLLKTYGVSPEASMGLSLYIFLVTVITGLLGIPFVFTFKRKKVNR
jgi:glycosyltransferase 2 family protein